MADNQYDFYDVINYFMEDEQLKRKAEAIIHRAYEEQQNSVSQRNPITLLNNCPEHERGILDQYFQNMNDQIKRDMTKDNTQQSTPASTSYVGGFSLGPLVQSIQNFFHPKKENGEVSIYDLMSSVLEQVQVVNYEGCIYWREGAVFRPVDDMELQKRLFIYLEPFLAAGKNPRIITNVMDLLKKNPRICASQTTEGPDRVFFLNGVYNLQNHAFTPMAPYDFFTSYFPFEYRPELEICPYFERFIASVSGGDTAVQQLIWEVLGYILSFDMSAKAFFVLQGVGDSGKSVFGNLVSSFFNPEALAHLDIYRFKDRFSTSALRGKRLNICMDLPRAKISREAIGTIKMLTGDDTITIEEKFRQSESYKPTCKLLFGSNFPLMPGDNDPAFRARLITIPFRYAVPKEQQDKHLLDKLLAERSAIAVKALDAYLELRRRNYRFPVVQGICDMNGYVAENELMERFVRECCQFRPDGFVFTADLQEAYNAFRASCNVPPIMDTSTFSKQFNAFCAGRAEPKRVRRDGRNLNGYVGVALLG